MIKINLIKALRKLFKITKWIILAITFVTITKNVIKRIRRPHKLQIQIDLLKREIDELSDAIGLIVEDVNDLSTSPKRLKTNITLIDK